MIYELEGGNLNKITENYHVKKVSLISVYQKQINDKFTLLINSFKNKVLVVESNKINNGTIEIDSTVSEWLETPSSNSDYFKCCELYDEKMILESKKKILISLVLTYSCNLRCSYCFQQKYDKLSRKPITLEKLEIILDKISLIIRENPDIQVSIGLFGGEPLLPKNELIIDRVFKYCVDHRLKIGITTNGVFLPYFAKKLIIYRSVIAAVAITVNSLPENYEKIVEITRVANNVEKLLDVTDLLLSYGVTIDVGTNFDKTNIQQLVPMFFYFKNRGYFARKTFYWNIGRVDNRLFDTNYDDYILSETDILLELMKIHEPIPPNLHAGFIQTCKNLTDKLNLSFNEIQCKGIYNYCWNVSPYDRVFYIDNNLNLFRCTVTVGRPEYILGNLRSFDLLNYQNDTKTFLDYKECQKCEIGGLCSGGCKLSADIDFYKQCRLEKKEFENFVSNILIPVIVEKMRY